MNPGILDLGYAPPQMPRPLLGQPQPVPTPYGRSGDPYWGNVSLYLPLDGLHNSTSWTDLSPNRFTVSSFSSVAISRQTGPFQNGSTLFDAAGKRLTVPAGSAFAYGTADFTIEAWVYRTVAAESYVFTQTVSGINYLVFAILGTGQARFTGTASGGGTAIDGPATTLAALNTWAHVAVVRSSGSITVYCNGVGGTPTTTAGAAVNYTDTTRIPTVGRYTHADTSRFQGHIGHLRITKGVARYFGSSFPPPTAPFPIGYQ